MKLAISGKGGVGKTTLAGMLAATLSLAGRDVIALDADPDANLAAALGIPAELQPAPLARMKDLIAERTGSKSNYGGYFKLNPRVDDIPRDYSVTTGRVRLLVLGGVSRGGGGCICPASALVKALLGHLILGRDDALIMDMEAGIEHLGRATAGSMDALVTVVGPGSWSIQTAHRVCGLAGDLGMKNVFAVANRVDSPGQEEQIQRELGDIPLIGRIPFDPRLSAAPVRRDEQGQLAPTDALNDHRRETETILKEIQNRI